MLDMVGNPEDRFSRVEAQLVLIRLQSFDQSVKKETLVL